MSDTILVCIAVVVAMVVGYVLGFITAWKFGRQAGEADGIAWSTERLKEASASLEMKERKRP